MISTIVNNYFDMLLMASDGLIFSFYSLLFYFQVPRVCPGCRTAWRMLEDTGDVANTSDQEGHEVAGQDDNTRVPMAASTGARRVTRASQSRKAKLEESSDDENGNDDDDDESDGAQPAPSPPVSQRRVINSRKKMKARR